MTNEFTAIIEQDGHWFIAYSPEIPGANGQGKTKDEARASLGEAIKLILEDRRNDGLPEESPSIAVTTRRRYDTTYRTSILENVLPVPRIP